MIHDPVFDFSCINVCYTFDKAINFQADRFYRKNMLQQCRQDFQWGLKILKEYILNQYTDRQHIFCRQETDKAGLDRQHRRANAPNQSNGYK